ncbi:MAG TPA: DUF1365 family protein [Miltoncostaeaceae bacterium]|nr:DUF1365 family protein [Miltoncostaeaceae bacterium]
MRSAIYAGALTHARRGPAAHRFRYRSAMLAVDLDEGPALDRHLRLLAWERPGPVAIRAEDHAGDARRGLRGAVEEQLVRDGIDLAGGRITLVTLPRVLGYAFNPISLFWCHGPDGAPRAVVAEVSNTFGERHLYTLPAGAAERRGPAWIWEVDKRMHVSPFHPAGGRYRFALTPPGSHIHIGITYVHGEGPPFHASFAGVRRPLTDREIALQLLRTPLAPPRVTALIHLEALRLWRRGAPFHRLPRFRPGEGSVPPAGAAAPARRGLHPPPPPRRSPVTPVVRALTPWALSRPPRGEVTLRTPDGRVRRWQSPRPGTSAELTVNSRDLYRRIARRGMTGVGEAYVAGDWDADDLAAAVEVLLRAADGRRRGRLGRVTTAARDRRPRLPARMSHERARRFVGYHYDLGNDLYGLFLDETRTYSCAIFDDPGATLEEAQLAKHRRICDKLRLQPGDHVLEIGCGWGAFARVAAEDYGARVTGVTLSHDQHAHARRVVAEAGLDGRVDIRLQDYRTLRGTYAAIASTEMIEAIGHRELPTFFRACERLLADDGLVCLQAITMPDQRYDRYRRSRDWITQYVFPGATCPSLSALVAAARDASDLVVNDVEDIGPHYAETLRRWRERFEARHGDVRALGFDEEFVRAWRFYLASCEAAFRARSIQDLQIVLARPLTDRLSRTSRRAAPAAVPPAAGVRPAPDPAPPAPQLMARP